MKCRVAKDKAELVQALVNAKGTTAPFQTYADAIAFAAAMGAKHKRRIPVKEISKTEPAPISLEIFISRGYDRLIKLLAISETNDRNILSIYDYKAEEERVLIFEESANGGLEILRHELRGAVDYTERILLIMSQERFQDESIEEEFDLRRFL